MSGLLAIVDYISIGPTDSFLLDCTNLVDCILSNKYTQLIGHIDYSAIFILHLQVSAQPPETFNLN